MIVELLEASNNKPFIVSRVCGHLFLLAAGLLMIFVEAWGQDLGHLESPRISSSFLLIALALRGEFLRPTGMQSVSIQTITRALSSIEANSKSRLCGFFRRQKPIRKALLAFKTVKIRDWLEKKRYSCPETRFEKIFCLGL